MQVKAMEWLCKPDAAPEHEALKNSKELQKAALLYYRSTYKKPFFTAAPPTGPVDPPKLNFFGRTPPPGAQDPVAAEQGEAADAGAGAQQQQQQAGAQGAGPARRRRRLASLQDEDTEEEELEAVVRAPSVCDRLRNACARCVMIAHKLLGDPDMVGAAAKQTTRDVYFAAVDAKAVELMSKCKLWLGGTKYAGAR
jgi:hypothetical protein